MKTAVSILLFLTLGSTRQAFADDIGPGFHDESEAGLVAVGGNSSSNSVNLKQTNLYKWNLNLLKFNGKYLEATSNGTKTAQYWLIELRYEFQLTSDVSAYVGQNVESDTFAGYAQRYNSDVGGKYFLLKDPAKEPTYYWDAEAGYRYSIENRASGQVRQSYLRFYTEANRDWTKTFSTKADVEYLPNLDTPEDYQINSEAAVSAALSSIFALKTGYLIKYRNILLPPATSYKDTQFTTSLVAKF